MFIKYKHFYKVLELCINKKTGINFSPSLFINYNWDFPGLADMRSNQLNLEQNPFDTTYLLRPQSYSVHIGFGLPQEVIQDAQGQLHLAGCFNQPESTTPRN